MKTVILVTIIIISALLPSMHVQAQDIVIYPPDIDTDYEKLVAIYSLLEQCRIEYNKFGSIARSDVDYYINSGKWKKFEKIYHDKIKWLLNEQNILKDKILFSTYTIKQLQSMTFEERMQAELAIFGDRLVLGFEPTAANTPVIADIKAIDLGKLSSDLSDPIEDLTTYTEVDPNNHLTVNSTGVTFTNFNTNEDAYLYDDKGVNHFNGDFEHLFDCMVTASSTGSFFFTDYMTNIVDDIKGIVDAAGDGQGAMLYGFTGGRRVYAWEIDGGTEYADFADINQSVRYWVKVKRDEAVGANGTLYIYVYSDAARTVQIVGSPLSIALHTSKKDFRYLFGGASYNMSDATRTISGWSQNFDLQEAPAVIGVPTNFDAFYVDVNQIGFTWTTGVGANNTMIRGKQGTYPANVTDGYQVYFGNATSTSDTSVDFDLFAGDMMYRAWGELSGNYSATYAEDYVGGVPVTLIALSLLALGLTVAMFAAKNSMLGFPCVIFWAVLGGYAYGQFVTPWVDWEFYLMIAALMGMVPFSALAAWGLREKRDTIADQEMEKGEPDFISEEKEQEEERVSPRTRKLRERAARRREGEPRSVRW